MGLLRYLERKLDEREAERFQAAEFDYPDMMHRAPIGYKTRAWNQSWGGPEVWRPTRRWSQRAADRLRIRYRVTDRSKGPA